jgi:hypothetical protein
VVNQAISVGAQVMGGMFTAVSSLSGDPSSASSMQSLVVIAMTSCGQPTSKQTVSNYRSLGPLPVGVDGYAGVILGNLVLCVGVLLAQLAVVGVVALRRRRPFVEGCVTVKCPSISIALFFALYQGTFFSAAQLATLPDSTAWERVGGSVAFAVCFAAPLVAVWFCREHARRTFFEYVYLNSGAYRVLYMEVIPRLMLPIGRVQPDEVRAMYGSLVSSYRFSYAALPILPALVPFWISILSLWRPRTRDGCAVFLSLVSVGHVSLAMAVLIVRPFRFSSGSVLFSGGVMLNFVFVVFSLTALYAPRAMSTQSASLMTALQLTLQMVKILLLVIGIFLEKRLNHRLLPRVKAWSTEGSRPFPNESCAADVHGDELTDRCDAKVPADKMMMMMMMSPLELRSNQETLSSLFVTRSGGGNAEDGPVRSDTTGFHRKHPNDDDDKEEDEEDSFLSTDLSAALRGLEPVDEKMVLLAELDEGHHSVSPHKELL